MNDRVASSQPQSGVDGGNGPVAIPPAQLLRSRISRVCAAIAASSPEEMIQKAYEAARENAFLEFRLDYLAKPADVIPKIKKFLYELGEVTAIATCRRVPNGGKFKGSIHAEIEILRSAIEAGCDLIDIEIETAEEMKPAELEKIRSLGAALIISHHDFKTTGNLDKIFERIERFHPDYMKVVSTATCLADNVKMIRFLERTGDRANMIGICMGEQGLISRVLGVRAGSVFTFASASPGEETGPGQISARTLREIYRIDEVSPATRVYGVVGNPVTHSLSPLIHNLAFRRETVNAVFLALQATEMKDVLTLVEEIPLHGLAVTMPFKGEILKHLANTDDLSGKIGACNTVVRALEGKLYGFNTDVAAIVRPLERRLPLRGARVLVIGAGGAARAAVFGLKDRGADVTIVNRTPEAAQKLARQAKAKAIKYEQLAKASFDVILNATPIGMRGHKQQSWLKPEQLNARLVFDMVYNPIETPLLRMAREKGLPVITGVEMFVQQGARQFEIWTGKPAPEEEMLRAVVHALRQRGVTGEEEAGQTSVAGMTGPAKRLASVSSKVEKPVVAQVMTPAAGAVKKTVADKTPAKAVAGRNGHGGAAVAAKAAQTDGKAKPEQASAKPVKATVKAKAVTAAKKPVVKKNTVKAAARPVTKVARPAKAVKTAVRIVKPPAGAAKKAARVVKPAERLAKPAGRSVKEGRTSSQTKQKSVAGMSKASAKGSRGRR
jgi:3-dehydroquinate dehydratase/shikimate dehydrogenase